MASSKLSYLKKNFDDLAIAGILGRLAVQKIPDDFNQDELSVLAALRRANPKFSDIDPDEIGVHIDALDENQLMGLVSATKGILHELEFIHIENSDGDSVTASVFTDTNYPDYDVLLFDQNDSTWSSVQLKASDSTSYVQEWVDNHPEGEILVTEELAENMGLPTSGSSNEELTVRTEDFLDKLQELDAPGSLAGSLALLTPLSVCIASWGLIRRRRAGLITEQVFRTQLMLITGKKALRFGTIALLMAIPVINLITGVLLLSKLLLGLQELADRKPKGCIDI